ncbi:hypothetical protein HYZ99_04170 [Candidatus Peregrinibacteria bacterium]|nr:hypothetical protein [Candidatus Peregrinibacteria bacterium]
MSVPSATTRNRPGFTLIEFILYTGLTAIILVSLLRSMLAVLEAREKLSTIHPPQEELRFAAQRITTTIRNALDINVSASLFNADAGTLSLSMSGSAMNPTIFSLANGAITIKNGAASALPLTSPQVVVDQLRFENLSAPNAPAMLKLRLRAYAATDAGDPLSLETSVSLRQ